MESSKSDNSNKPAVQLLQEINSGQTDPSLLDKLDRQKCIELLISEGYSYAHMAQVLKCSEKTISRDIKEIREHNALSPNVQFAKEFIGDAFRKAMSHHDYLVRLSRTKEASIAEKSQAVFMAWRVLKEFIEKYQTLGYLPQVAQRIEGDFFHHQDIGDNENGILEMKKALGIVEATAKETGTFDAETEEQIHQVKSRIEKLEIESDINKLSEEQDKKQEDKNETDK